MTTQSQQQHNNHKHCKDDERKLKEKHDKEATNYDVKLTLLNQQFVWAVYLNSLL